jgi:peptidoglycan-associated lipoprotein
MLLNNPLKALAVGFLVVGTTTACATKGFVRTQVDGVGQRIETVSQSLERTQEATKENQARITQVDAKTDQVGIWAKDAQTLAQGAQTSADSAHATAATAVSKIDAVDAKSKRLVYEVVISEDQGNFKFGSAQLPEAARTRIDELIEKLKADPRGNYVEIEGHTDSIGEKTVNQRIGEERAEAVKRYLYEAHQVPLHKMNVISYGAEKPVSPNNTPQGRAQNRRVVIRILA